MTITIGASLDQARADHRLDDEAVRRLAAQANLRDLTETASALRDAGHGDVVSYSRKVFIPLTKLCRDVCHYCTFAHPPRKGERAFLTPDEILEIARQGVAAGCKEALFTLGDKPELRYRVVREELARLGYETTLDYLRAMSALVLAETGLLPHLNPGVLTASDVAALRQVSVSQGIMIETVSERLSQRGGPHFGSPDKHPAPRLETLRNAGEAAVPFTSGLLIGIGETRAERLDAILELRRLHERHGHLQEIIIQPFRAKPGTRMSDAPEPATDELVWTLAMTRIALGSEANIQAPPNLSPDGLSVLLEAGINDWGGVSPVTPDHVNPEAPWPHLDDLARRTAANGKILTERCALYPAYARNLDRWVDPALRTQVLRMVDGQGFPRIDDWTPGADAPPPTQPVPAVPVMTRSGGDEVGRILGRARDGERLDEAEIARLFEARGPEFARVCAAADSLRHETCGEHVTYVVNRNINYTNVCYFGCQFCAFSKGKQNEHLRGEPYQVTLEEIQRRTVEAWERGATEVCMQGGIHPRYTGETYIDICRAVKQAVPEMHIHAFSPLEVWQGARTLNQSVSELLERLVEAGLGSLPGTAAEVLDDEVRQVLCPDKIGTDAWIEGMEAAHGLGLKTTSTIMFGHVDGYHNWARHLLRLRDLQARTGGFTEFVPLPFVAMEAPLYLKGRARRGPTFRECVLMHAVGRLALHPLIANIQVSWVKMGPEGVRTCLQAGANDLGGTLMNESITSSAGARHGQEMPPERMDELIRSVGRTPAHRTTLYAPVSEERRMAGYGARPLEAWINTPVARRRMRQLG
ncbi:5-amino-6-(D-ribitylamino)uracil--L-tyrosine 4-hydroxyphenyl transferase CofH [Ferruginivarius sediminum]|uniref:FO synthase n=1 Tax=Ferruginivarius sediminum TaxID=2661937 RepID=A0A369T511_9PROT|nr:5-amino-6-(D-ribitylamino)uracil--L-tyrosine 4-hydroxyphenyl transferase CofH [Ferruginivarius sediminum]RDD60409.1 7,8-didemethyl-8-hydroxy-5-deazariboflavin synthase subunit CofH [Ferruginivarius sediminum]